MSDQSSSTELYPVFDIQLPTDATHAGLDATDRQQEQMGSKRKFWFYSIKNSIWYLFKYSREGTGEHWAEKIACEIARLLGLPHARVELAVYQGSWGAAIEELRPDRDQMSLLHGNELLLELDQTYPADRSYRVSAHTVRRVSAVLETQNVNLPASLAFPRPMPLGAVDAFDLFVGYLLLDAVIGNTDRHHENWAVIASKDPSGSRDVRLAPTYDHASCLGRELRDEARNARLDGEGTRGVPGYAERARSALYDEENAQAPLTTRQAFAAAAELRPNAGAAWISRLKEVGLGPLQGTLDRLPPSSASKPAIAFARALIGYNYQVLTDPTQISH